VIRMRTLGSIKILFLMCLAFAYSTETLAQKDTKDTKDTKDFAQIKKILFQQEEDWNKGDIDAFMTAYWNSEELQFGGANGITKGWQQTLDNYKKGYPDQASMGKLTFEIKDMTRHSKTVVSLTGSWELQRENDRPGGHFLLIWRKIKGEWKIVVDHTSTKAVL
jgi:ketosteroid isomerase-like protein